MRAEDVTQSPRQAGLVKRYHTWPTLRTQTVAEHCWQVMRIYCELFGSPIEPVWEYILHHDSGEVATGDVPFPVKRDNAVLAAEIHALEDAALAAMGVDISAKLPSGVKARIKFCDLLEMLEYCSDEVLMGNRFAEPMLRRLRAALAAYAPKVPVDEDQAARIDAHLERIYARHVFVWESVDA